MQENQDEKRPNEPTPDEKTPPRKQEEGKNAEKGYVLPDHTNLTIGDDRYFHIFAM